MKGYTLRIKLHARQVLILLFAVFAAAAPGYVLARGALADNSGAVADCNAHGHLTHRYTAPQLQNALSTMGADIKEYTDCYDVIRRALLASAAGGRVGGGPGVGPNAPNGGPDSLPTALIIVLAVLGLAAGGAGGVTMRRAIVRRRGEPGP